MTVTPIRKPLDPARVTELAQRFTIHALFGVAGLCGWLVFKLIEVTALGGALIFDALYQHVFKPLAENCLSFAIDNGIRIRE